MIEQLDAPCWHNRYKYDGTIHPCISTTPGERKELKRQGVRKMRQAGKRLLDEAPTKLRYNGWAT